MPSEARPDRRVETAASSLSLPVRSVVLLSVVVNAALMLIDLLIIATSPHVSAVLHGWIQLVLLLPIVTNVSLWRQVNRIADQQIAQEASDVDTSDAIGLGPANRFPNWLRVLSVTSICLSVYFVLVTLGTHVRGFAPGYGRLQAAMILAVISVWLLRRTLS